MNEEIVFKYFPELDARQREQTAALGQLYAEWNARINVISRKDMDSLYLHHVLHSLARTCARLCFRRRLRRRIPWHSYGHCHAGVPVHPL